MKWELIFAARVYSSSNCWLGYTHKHLAFTVILHWHIFWQFYYRYKIYPKQGRHTIKNNNKSNAKHFTDIIWRCHIVSLYWCLYTLYVRHNLYIGRYVHKNLCQNDTINFITICEIYKKKHTKSHRLTKIKQTKRKS